MDEIFQQKSHSILFLIHYLSNCLLYESLISVSCGRFPRASFTSLIAKLLKRIKNRFQLDMAFADHFIVNHD